MLAEYNEGDGKDIPPPPYSPERPPPPYVLQNTLTDNKESRGRVAPTPFTPFSTGATTIAVHPRPASPPPTIVSTDSGVNPSSQPTTTAATETYKPKKATTAEPYDEFCPKCQCRCRTRQKFISGKLTWLLVIIILLVCFPLAFLPFLIKSCKDVHHFCPKCKTHLSTKKRFFF